MAEKWNQSISEHGDEIKTPEMRSAIHRNLKKVPNHFDEINKLEKTEREIKIIFDINEALKKYLDFMGLDPLEIPESDICVLEESYYRSLKGVNTIQQAHQTYGGIHSRILIPRMENESEFIKILAHEMVHAASYHRTKLDVVIKDDGVVHTNIGQVVRSGYGFKIKDSSKTNSHNNDFSGPNEAMTEFIAWKVRRNYYKSQGEDGEKAEELARMGAYTLEFGILHRVLQKYKELGNDEQQLMVDIQRGYFLGDMRPLKKLQVIHPDIVKIFRDMKHSDISSLISTAQALGFVEYVEKLEEIAKTIKK